MSFPAIPNIAPSINITLEESVNLLLASIAFEELGLAHVINAEAEKIQFVLGTLPGQATSLPPDTETLISIDRSVDSMIHTVIKQQMLLQFKLENVLEMSPESTTTETTTTTTTTTTSSTTTTTTETATTTTTSICPSGLNFAVFANNNLSLESKSVINGGTQVNGNITVANSSNTLLGDTNIVGTYSDTSTCNTYQNLVLHSVPVPFTTFSPRCLQSQVDLILNGNQDIASTANAAIYQGKTVWVNGTATISGANISITGGGILATGGITVSGGSFTYNSSKCFALYSQTGDIRINNGPYNITGLLYTAENGGDIWLAADQGGTICGAVISGRNVFFTGNSAFHAITNTCSCSSPCLRCDNLCQ